MSYLTHLECSLCGKGYPADELFNLCPDCSRPLLARYDLNAAKVGWDRGSLTAREPTLWRYREGYDPYVKPGQGFDFYGNKALGEPPIISPPPAIRNAIWDATGVKINELPMTPHVLYRYFKKAGLL